MGKPVGHEIIEGDHAAGGGTTPVTDLVQPALQSGEQLVDVAVDTSGVDRHLRGVGADLDQLAQVGLLPHDLRVVPGVGGRGHHGDQGVQIRRPTHSGQLTTMLQLC
ncbi:hypothetical protein ACFSVJ_31055 [Prauserella oleivorans]